MSFRIAGLDPKPFLPLFALSEAELTARGIERVVVASRPGAPCRITLDDAEPGEPVLLLSYQHQSADTPYRQQGPIFVSKTPVPVSTRSAQSRQRWRDACCRCAGSMPPAQ